MSFNLFAILLYVQIVCLVRIANLQQLRTMQRLEFVLITLHLSLKRILLHLLIAHQRQVGGVVFVGTWHVLGRKVHLL
jgi:hypothetical protein